MGNNNLLIFFIILAAINLAAFILVGMDKKRSRLDDERVPEVYLFVISIFFATLGVLVAMYYFHHKIRKPYFPIGLGCLALEQVVLLVLLAEKYHFL